MAAGAPSTAALQHTSRWSFKQPFLDALLIDQAGEKRLQQLLIIAREKAKPKRMCSGALVTSSSSLLG